MFFIDAETMNICLSYANTMQIDFLLETADPSVTISPVTDKIYMSIKDIEGNELFAQVYDIVSEQSNHGIVNKWIFTLTHEQSKMIEPGTYTWDFTYWKDAIIENGKPIGGLVVDTPFCERAKAQFIVQEVNSSYFSEVSGSGE